MTTTDGDKLDAGTGMGLVSLHVGDLAAQSEYYRTALALDPISETDGEITLGRGAVPLVRLRHTPGLPVPSRRAAGLFHTALLFETPSDLAATVYRAAQHNRSQFVGSSDHHVSEAFYFTDPEGNGIELYTDRPRDTWLDASGRIAMATEYLDPNAYLRANLVEATADAPQSAGADVGHVHLQVGDVDTAKGFYVDTLGFETTTTYPGALFVSAGGYHHHVALNVWNSAGAGPRAATLGLGQLTIEVPARSELDAVSDRLRSAGLQFADDGAAITVLDPWNSEVVLRTRRQAVAA
ncbi:VOC family protein [Pseudoclavibacter helvolus]|uniref:Catechol 2,3-dioxygenase n=1 Tax=Pseudoclavibacter helvolus TaxID=255205 RepID=A0A7W4UKX4_9MICO|nr:VOC family protein [Pseudoclavibacter helvolus]MBB2956364.1 catechol 2,3-dioxygenase [Pseudoclavibacter helvolus]